MRRLMLSIVVAGMLSACSGNSTPAAPTPPPVAACVSQNTADVTLVNASPTNLTYDVLIDNISRGTIGPGQSRTFTVTAGASHTVLSRFTNTSLTACTSTTSFIQCTTQALTCRG